MGDVYNVTPAKENLHSLKALSNAVVLDVLLPNYDEKERFCNYYQILTPLEAYASKGSTLVFKYLLEPPESLKVRVIPLTKRGMVPTTTTTTATSTPTNQTM
jgi:hypothetical protein